jgi:secreted trypsin-like serine protease
VTLRRPLFLALASLALLTPTAPAIVGGTDVPEGERGYVAFITIDQVASCTGTLVSPTFVITAGHCSNLGTGTPVNVPIGKAGQEIEVTLGSVKRDDPAGEKPAVKRVIVHPDYVFTENLGSSYDVALLELATPSKQTPVKVVGKGEEALFAPGTMAQIAGFGLTEENGSSAQTMQQAEVPITTDDYAKSAYESFEAGTQLGAGFPQGGVDSCQGDSGGPLIVKAPDGSLRLVGDTSYGDGCARAGKPGIYGRLGSDQMRDFIIANAPDAVAKPPAATPAPASTTSQPQSQPQTQPASQPRSTPAKKKKAKRRTPCNRLHRGSARHNRSARHKRQVRRCVKKRRAARARAQLR